MSILLILLTIVAAFWLLRRLLPILLLWLLSRQQRKWSGQFGAMGGQGERASRQSSARKEGEVTVESGNVERTVNGSVGEYVEYEEEK